MAGDLMKSNLDKDLTTLYLQQYPRNETKCPLRVIELFPNWFTTKTPRSDYIAYAALIAIYLSVAIFIVCDEYYVPSLERICYKFKISYAVAGALLLPVATSSPELLVGLYVTFLTEGDMVTDTIAGSSVFNSLAIPSICCLLTKVDYCIDWWPITRDMLWHNVAIFFVALFMHNDYIRWFEALLLVCLYYYYVGHLCMDAAIQNIARDPAQPCLFECCTKSLYEVKDAFSMEDLQGQEEAFNFLKWPPKAWRQKLFWLVSYPWQLIFFFTIPSVRRRCTLNCYILGMFMSLCWIAALSYLFTWCLVIIGFNFHVIEPVMRLIVLAVGLSIPEAICGVIVTRKEYGSMAVCCAFGSNIMDICLCLGAPWLIKCLYQPTHSTKYEIYFRSDPSPFTTPGILIAAIMFYLFLLIKHFEWRPAVGFMCLVEYLVFISMAVTIEQLYGELIKPHCTPTIF